MQVSGKQQKNVHLGPPCALWQRVKHWSHRSGWEECVRVRTVDGAVAPFESHLTPDVDPALGSTVGSSTTAAKPYSGKCQLAQSVAGVLYLKVL